MPSMTSPAANAIAFENSIPAPDATSEAVECVPAISPIRSSS